jgi:hypothetical protein
MVRLSDVTVADVISDAEMIRRLTAPRDTGVATATGQPKPRIVARWRIDAASGRPVCDWIVSA